MDPVTVFGIISGGVQVAGAILSTVDGLNKLLGKFNDADLTIGSLIRELKCIRTALTSLREWAETNARGPTPEEYLEGLTVAMDGCQTVMEVLEEDVSTLVRGTHYDGAMRFRTRVKVMWNEEAMQAHQGRLHAQVLALQLLLQVCQW
ncbi:hypothetical protein N7510_005544 [Penicillium lagena]|uniref:uncharacterized protein n=1 Tax=Penicillium lagena TaxID=94218 RepID=UPI00254249C5|nr:uncharacterized protein N7510_005544 [Penicillium lagena]KAJ5612350.1 hypothetical protein N7510_005544 [Penicillium lagena]